MALLLQGVFIEGKVHVAEHGAVGNAAAALGAVGFAARAGLIVPLGERFYLDGAGQYGLWGLTGGGGLLGIGCRWGL